MKITEEMKSRADLVDRICDTLEKAYDEGADKTSGLAALIGVAVSEAITAGMSEVDFVESVRHSFRRTKMYARELDAREAAKEPPS